MNEQLIRKALDQMLLALDLVETDPAKAAVYAAVAAGMASLANQPSSGPGGSRRAAEVDQVMAAWADELRGEVVEPAVEPAAPPGRGLRGGPVRPG
jgi:hypothetical protein